MPIVQKRRLLILIPLVVAGFAIALLLETGNHEELRLAGANALRAVSILFALLAAASIALLNTYVSGLREAAKEQISVIRNILDEISNSSEVQQYEELASLVENHINPLRSLSLQEWLEYDEANHLRNMPDDKLISLNQKCGVFFARHFLRLEDEFNELGLLFVRRICSKLHFETAQWSFGFLIASMVLISASYIAPSTQAWNSVVFVLEAVLVAAVIVNASFLFSFFLNEASEEVSIYSSGGK